MAQTNYVPNLGEFIELSPIVARQLYSSVSTPTGTAPEGSINITDSGSVYKMVGGVWTLIGPKLYVALLTQTGTDAPVATVLENSLGVTITWSYESEGAYLGTSSVPGIFISSKTCVTGQAFAHGIGNGTQAGFGRDTDDRVVVTTGVAGDHYENGVLDGNKIEILVYP